MNDFYDGSLLRFAVPIYSRQLEERSLRIIREATLEYIQLNPQKFTTPGGWSCPTLSNIESNADDYGDGGVLMAEIEGATMSYYQAWGFPPCDLRIEKAWINIAGNGAYQELHDHLQYLNNRLFSGVLYIKAGKNQGHLQLRNPIKPYAHCMLPSGVFDDCVIEPRDGLLVCFPSWMSHCVGTNTTEETRISIAWNVFVKKQA